VRDILERASARETAARVAGGAVAKAFLAQLGVRVLSHVLQIASIHAPRRHDLVPEDFATVDESPVRCLDRAATTAMVAELDRLRQANESLGGVFEVRAFGLVPGLGSHVSWEERLDGRLGHLGGDDRRNRAVRAVPRPRLPAERRRRSTHHAAGRVSARPTSSSVIPKTGPPERT